MRTIMAKNPHESFSFSRRYFNFKKKVEDEDYDDEVYLTNFHSSSQREEELNMHSLSLSGTPNAPRSKKLSRSTVSILRSALTFGKSRTHFSSGLGTKVVGTLFGYRRGHVHFAFQEDPKLSPAFFVELATPTSHLVREMASGLVRIALEADKRTGKKAVKLLEEPIWRTYCNGRKCGYGMKRECGPEEWKILNSIGPVSMGAGVLPSDGDGIGSEGELMYMRAKFERVVGSKDSEAFYMMNPDGHGGPELSLYLLRV
ncbi:protein MIZU-KUSSEI 1-like [Nicotiana tabacum]|uniref:Protein MIZU-KUSSEI 1-like n=2 Tax=Nicotiana TaxID=4085 RepID=A0A1S4A2F6_TOBAC|nr:PREDICTED: protein MIZU-KUSSEI 1 [Nicotiana sylvestris]XP_016470751.1 PREDICTED: protein MIZU-KUSSEI 1-like [Nicotiana tabacum]